MTWQSSTNINKEPFTLSALTELLFPQGNLESGKIYLEDNCYWTEGASLMFDTLDGGEYKAYYA